MEIYLELYKELMDRQIKERIIFELYYLFEIDRVDETKVNTITTHSSYSSEEYTKIVDEAIKELENKNIYLKRDKDIVIKK